MPVTQIHLVDACGERRIDTEELGSVRMPLFRTCDATQHTLNVEQSSILMSNEKTYKQVESVAMVAESVAMVVKLEKLSCKHS